MMHVIYYYNEITDKKIMVACKIPTQQTLQKITHIVSGITFRECVATSSSGKIRMIQMKDLGKDHQVHLETAVRINDAIPSKKLKLQHFLQKGDIIFCSRGQNNTASLLHQKTPNTIFSNPLFRIRVTSKEVIPEYLLWWINQPESQNYLRKRSEGTMLKMISKKTLANLVVKLPPRNQQSRIAQFYQLAMQEKKLLEKLKQCKYSHAQRILMQMASAACLPANNQSKTEVHYD